STPSCLRPRPPPRPPPFPYTTLFRSRSAGGRIVLGLSALPQLIHRRVAVARAVRERYALEDVLAPVQALHAYRRIRAVERAVRRSEEHTSELQSRENLVCRLLLEKKK